ncbi:hypothetical protein SAMN02745165_01944 [Malonomonas rubra DSM 5091]|uniref:Uncharacterized protein n=1 Tax=Malonomonas rubra DSM 5091 TaxID=1122189 RepID=A0A1M6HZH7_MALRU|nr:MXAN_5187 C-terminal domain-containing protein [Malonomonas rubra]SHJ27669.1 hypothetical protein SAMN02745165_01944 [Malonomonas rubra DSM 5091]
MNEKRELAHELDEIQQQMKELEIRYEQYFAGVEKREPVNDRKNIARKLRQYVNRRIVWTDMKFRCQGMMSRFASYSQYWDRILRLMDEGKYHRHTAKLHKPSVPAEPQKAAASKENEAQRLQRELADARSACGLKGAPSATKVAEFLDAQKEKIRERYGDRDIVFSVDASDGKPRIKVSLKK